MKFTLSAYDEGSFENEVFHTFTGDELSDVLMFMNSFLRGCGYVYDGALDVVESDKSNGIDEDMLWLNDITKSHQKGNEKRNSNSWG